MSTTSFGTSRQSQVDDSETVFYFTVRTQNDTDDEGLWQVARQTENAVRQEISAMVPAFLGTAFRLRKIELHRGSVTFWIYVMGAFTLVSQYADFLNSMNLFISQVQRLLRSVFESFPGVVITGGQFGAKEGRSKGLSSLLGFSRDPIMAVLVIYLIMSHAFMLVVLARIVSRLLLPSK